MNKLSETQKKVFKCLRLLKKQWKKLCQLMSSSGVGLDWFRAPTKITEKLYVKEKEKVCFMCFYVFIR